MPTQVFDSYRDIEDKLGNHFRVYSPHKNKNVSSVIKIATKKRKGLKHRKKKNSLRTTVINGKPHTTMLQRKRKSVQRKVKEGHSKLNLTRKRKLKKGKERMTTTKLVQEAQEKQKKKIITGRPKANGLPRSPAMTYPIEAGPTQVVTKGRLNNHFNLKTHSPAIVGQSVYVSEMPSAVSVTDMALAPTESLQAQEMRPDLSNVGKIGMANIHHSSSAHSVGINLFWISFLTVWMTLYLRQK